MPIIMNTDGRLRCGTIWSGVGMYHDTTAKILRSGTFIRGKLTGSDCSYITYGTNTLLYKEGTYSNNLANGEITEYEFTDMDHTLEEISEEELTVVGTKKVKIYANGVEQSEESSEAASFQINILHQTHGNQEIIADIELIII